MPPKKTTPATKGAVTKGATSKGAAKKPATKTTAVKKPVEKKEEKKEEPPKAEAPKVVAKRKIIGQKQIAKVLIEDDDKDLRSYGRAALVVDNENHIAARFLPYSGANVLEAMNPSNMDPERIRLAVIGAVRHGKPLSVDFGECDANMLEVLETKFDDVQKGLLEKCMNRDICKRDVYESLVKDSDDDNYKVASYYDFENEVSAKFIFMIVMKQAPHPPSFTEKFYTFTIE